MSVAVAEDLTGAQVQLCQRCREGPEESFQPVLCFIFDSIHFPFASEGTQLGQESQSEREFITAEYITELEPFLPAQLLLAICVIC